MSSVEHYPKRVIAVRRGRLLEYLTIIWNVLEGIISVVLGYSLAASL
jgi:hypothetical protein